MAFLARGSKNLRTLLTSTAVDEMITISKAIRKIGKNVLRHIMTCMYKSIDFWYLSNRISSALFQSFVIRLSKHHFKSTQVIYNSRQMNILALTFLHTTENTAIKTRITAWCNCVWQKRKKCRR